MSTRIAIIVEGATEKVFIPTVRRFLQTQLGGQAMPKLDAVPCHGRIPTHDGLRKKVSLLLSGKFAADAVVALTDVYTGTSEFRDAGDAKNKMRNWVGKEPRFYAHAAQHDFEAWLLPFWSDIQRLAGSTAPKASPHPEQVNHGHPPAYHLKEVFRMGNGGRSYVKTRDAARILREQNLAMAAKECPELKAFLNTLLGLCGAKPI